MFQPQNQGRPIIKLGLLNKLSEKLFVGETMSVVMNLDNNLADPRNRLRALINSYYADETFLNAEYGRPTRRLK